MEKLNYTFEHTTDGMYQVRLNGEFVCFSDHKNVAEIDFYLKDMGFESREDFLEYSIKQYMQ